MRYVSKIYAIHQPGSGKTVSDVLYAAGEGPKDRVHSFSLYGPT